MTTLFRGLPAAPGVGIGQIFIYRTWRLSALTTTSGPAADPEHEWQRFRAAQQAVDTELAELIQANNNLIADIFAAQRVILHDQTLLQAMREAIFQERQPVLNATQTVINHLAELFRNLGDDYLAGRAIDILDIGQRLLKQMDAPLIDPQPGRQIPPGALLIARDLTFSEITQLPFDHIAGIALAESTPTAHSAILARSLGIPLVCTLGEGILLLAPEQAAILDGHEGYLLVAPTADELTAHQVKRQAEAADRASAEVHAHEPAYTGDGLLIPVLANANNPEDITQAQMHGADGVGLLRTEYLFQNRIDPPTFEEQVDTYRYFVEQMAGRQLTVRALDIGGDKPMPYLLYGHEANPFLGLRGIRLLLAKPELLVTQYCALWQAAIDSCATELRFMLPMISTVEEVRAVRTLLTEAVPADQAAMIKIGVMIEVPSAALIADRIAPLVDFFSIGTNDLAQYVLATDRTNSSVAALADPLHPAVLRLIQLTCQAGAAHNIPVSICGEIGGDPQAVPLLLGLGLNELSVPVLAAPLVKAAVRRSTQVACRTLAEQALACPDSNAVRALLT
ncbi:MAG: phosphoenolpyruvate--protein phosphotransferase [Caldilinea sp. CFX5]|nr:phosphoenolpyruvate--protein phosphotransferase [Caldilinea sp. CFX5]